MTINCEKSDTWKIPAAVRRYVGKDSKRSVIVEGAGTGALTWRGACGPGAEIPVQSLEEKKGGCALDRPREEGRKVRACHIVYLYSSLTNSSKTETESLREAENPVSATPRTVQCLDTRSIGND